MKVVTVSTDRTRYFSYLEQSCMRNGCDLVVLGMGQKWQGYAWKFRLVHEYLASVPCEEIVCFVDAYDVIVIQPASEITRKFKKIKAILPASVKIICSEDKSSTYGPAYWFFNWLAFHSCQGTHINSGTYIGYAGDINELMDAVCTAFDCNDKDTNDQKIIQKYCQSNDKEFAIDRNQELFCVICSPATKIDLDTHQVNIDASGTLTINNNNMIIEPCFLHGSCNADLDDILVAMGYNVNKNQQCERSRFKYFLYNTKHFGKYFIVPIFVFVALIIGIYYAFKK